MQSARKPLKKIIVPTDFSELSDAALQHAVAWAERDGAAIHVVHAIRFPFETGTYEVSLSALVLESLRETAREKMQQLRGSLKAKGIDALTTEISEPDGAASVIEASALAHDADLIVMGTHGATGLKRAFLGSVTDRTLRSVQIPVLSVKGAPSEGAELIRRILVPVDFSQDSEFALDWAGDFAGEHGASLDVIHAIDPSPDYFSFPTPESADVGPRTEAAREHLEDVTQPLRNAGLIIERHVQLGAPSVVIAEAADRLSSDLIIMGRRGKSRLAHALLGSVADRTLRVVECPVLTLRTSDPDAAM